MQRDQSGGIIIVLIIFIVLAVLGIGLAIYFNSERTKLDQELAGAKASVTEKDTALRNAQKEVDQLKQIVGYVPEVAAETIVTNHENDVKLWGAGLPGSSLESKGYRRMLQQKESELVAKIKELSEANLAKIQLTDQFNNLVAQTTVAKEQYNSGVELANANLRDEQTQFQTQIAENQKAIEEERTKNQQLKQQSEELITAERTNTSVVKADLDKARGVNTNLVGKIEALTRVDLIQEDGTIISVNQRTGSALIDLGSSSGLRPGISFAVYDPENKNLSQATAKGSIEVVQILSARTAEVRINATVLTDPIQIGDLIYTPVWKPGQVQRFALCGRMILPGSGSRSGDRGEGIRSVYDDQNGLDTIRKIIMSNGALADCYMETDGTIVGAIDQNTAYLVEGIGDDLDQASMESMLKLQKDAEVNGVRIIKLPELLRMMGYRNSVPVRGYGNKATKSDMTPTPSSMMPVSSGKVSQLYDNRDTTARKAPGHVSPLYDTTGTQTARVSPGTVSPLYQKNRSAPPVSSGHVSDLYNAK